MLIAKGIARRQVPFLSKLRKFLAERAKAQKAQQKKDRASGERISGGPSGAGVEPSQAEAQQQQQQAAAQPSLLHTLLPGLAQQEEAPTTASAAGSSAKAAASAPQGACKGRKARGKGGAAPEAQVQVLTKAGAQASTQAKAAGSQGSSLLGFAFDREKVLGALAGAG